MLWVSGHAWILSQWMFIWPPHCDRYGLVGLLRPLTVYPSEMVYWGVGRSNFFSVKVTNIVSLTELTGCYDFPGYLWFIYMFWPASNNSSYVTQHYIMTARLTTSDSNSSGWRSLECSFTKLFRHISSRCWMGSIFFALRAKRHRLGSSTYLPTYLVVPIVMKAWVFWAFLSIGSILVPREIPFLSIFYISKLCFYKLPELATHPTR